MILNGVKTLKHLLQELNPSSEINLHSCLTTQVGNLRVVCHLKERFPTLLQYSRFLPIRSMRESRGLHSGRQLVHTRVVLLSDKPPWSSQKIE